MRKNPGFAAVAIVTLALGIGANTAVFSIVDAVLLQPLPYHEPERLVAVWNRWDGSARASLSDPEYLDYAEQSRLLEIAAMSPAGVNIGGAGGDPERVPSRRGVTANIFDVIGHHPCSRDGRFDVEEESAATTPVAILADGYWRRSVSAPTRQSSDPRHHPRRRDRDRRRRRARRRHAVRDHGRGRRRCASCHCTLDRTAPRGRRGGHYLMAIARLGHGATMCCGIGGDGRIVGGSAAQYPDQHNQGNFAHRRPLAA